MERRLCSIPLDMSPTSTGTQGKLRLVPLAELERWANENAESVFRPPRRA